MRCHQPEDHLSWTIKNAAEEDPEFDDRIHEAKIQCQYQALQHVNKAAETSWRAATWLLERCNLARFGPSKVEMVPRDLFFKAVFDFLDNMAAEIKDQNVLRRIVNRVEALKQLAEIKLEFEKGRWK